MNPPFEVLTWTFQVSIRSATVQPVEETQARLTFNTLDPAVITLAFHAQGSDQVWTFPREMLGSAISQPNLYGHGIVRVSTFSVRHLAKYLNILVGPHHSCIYVQFERFSIDQFYARTCDLVPVGDEETYYCAVIDAGLGELLRPPDPTT